MSVGLGLTVGSVGSVAATDDVAIAGGRTTIATDSTLTLPADGSSPVLALTAPGESPCPGVTVSGFASRVGDPVALVAEDGSTHTGEDLVAAAMRGLVDVATTTLDEPTTVVAAHPAVWHDYPVDALRRALDRAGLPDVTLVSEPEAAVMWLRRSRPSVDNGPVLVYDLGGSGLDVTLVGGGDQPRILGRALRTEDISGAEFDLSLIHI